ncbi:MAG TPA: NHL repeat-containing protein [Noviherbaspirillum sp.]|nr:NHL repeat-containing protein [Noviherbaspirillum sp.]
MTGNSVQRHLRGAAMLAALCLWLSGCASVDSAPADAMTGGALLTPSIVLAGAPLYAAPGPALNGLARPGQPRPAAPSYLNLLAPVAVAARDNTIYIADSGHHSLLRYDAAYMALSRFSERRADSVKALAVGPDMSLYVADPKAARVQHFSWDGRLLQDFASGSALSRPVGVLLDPAGAVVYVADNLYNHVVMFDPLGLPLGTLKSERAHSLAAMAGGPDGLYLLDPVAREVVVLGLDGGDRYAFGGGVLKQPSALAVDRYNRVYVADAFDNSIQVFERGVPVAAFGGGSGAAFGRIASLFVERDVLYVADTVKRAILTFRIAPLALPAPPRE